MILCCNDFSPLTSNSHAHAVLFSESGDGHAEQTVRAAEVSRRGETAGGAQQMVRPPIPRQRPRPEEDGHHVRQGDRRHFTKAARHLEEKSIRDGQRRTAQSREALNEQEAAVVVCKMIVVETRDSKMGADCGERTETHMYLFSFSERATFLFTALHYGHSENNHTEGRKQ